jgi:transposase
MGGDLNMEHSKGRTMGKLIFWLTFAFCAWIMWYISTPPPGFTH